MFSIQSCFRRSSRSTYLHVRMSHTSGLYRPRSISPAPQPPSSKKARVQSPEIDDGTAKAKPESSSGHTQDLMEVEAIPQITNSSSSQKRGGKGKPRRARKKPPPPESGSPEDVNLRDVFSLLGEGLVPSTETEGSEYDAPLELYSEVELTVRDIGSNGGRLFQRFNAATQMHSGLGESISLLPEPHKPWAVVVPFALPGEIIRARIYRHSRLHSYGDLLEIITPNTVLRDDSLVRCRYFGVCGGCQYQVSTQHMFCQSRTQSVSR